MRTIFKKETPIAIDISDHSIEVLQLNSRKEVVSYGRVVLDEGIVVNGEVQKISNLLEKINELFKIARPRILSRADGLQAIVSLPESKVFIHHIELPEELKGDDLHQRVMKEAERIIPFDPERIYSDYIDLSLKKSANTAASGRSKESQKAVLYVGALKEDVDEYIEVMRRAGIALVVLDMESISLGRALLKTATLDTISMIVDIGAKTTTISVFDERGMPNLSVTVPIAGNHLTQAIQEKLNVEEKEAEMLKRRLGFGAKRPNNTVYPILQEECQKIVQEIRKAMAYTQEKFGQKVEKIIIAGGSALIPDFDDFLSASLNVITHIGNPLEQIKKSQILEDSSPPILYANVIGLALRGINDTSLRDGINLLPEPIHAITSKKERSPSLIIALFLFAFAGQAILTFVIYYFFFR